MSLAMILLKWWNLTWTMAVNWMSLMMALAKCTMNLMGEGMVIGKPNLPVRLATFAHLLCHSKNSTAFRGIHNASNNTTVNTGQVTTTSRVVHQLSHMPHGFTGCIKCRKCFFHGLADLSIDFVPLLAIRTTHVPSIQTHLGCSCTFSSQQM